MLSLADELRKFEKMSVQETQLDGIITIEDGFSSGAVTVRDLVRENHVIVGEFKRMKNVFINYTRLNQKIFDKITEHELTFGSSIIKLGNMTNFFEKTIEGTLGQMKEVYEHTVYQNRAASDRLTREIEPISVELKNKVDLSHFNQVIKNLTGSSEHDSTELLKQQSVTSKIDEHLRKERDKERMKQVQEGEQPVQMKKLSKSTKKISEEELTTIKTEVLGQLTAVTTSIEDNMAKVLVKIQEVRKGLLTSIEESYCQTTTKVNDLESKSAEELLKLNGCVGSLTELLNKRTGAEAWDSHKKSVLDDVWAGMEPLKQKQDQLSLQMIQLDSKLAKQLNQLRNELTSEQSSLQAKLVESISSLQEKSRKETGQLITRLDEASRQHKQLKEFTQKAIQDTNRAVTTNRQEMLHETLSLRDTIKELSASLEASVLKQVIRSFQKIISKLESDMNELHRLEKEAGRRIDIVFQHLNDIKEVTGRKANFSDIVGLFEKKASKQEVTVLKDLLSSTDLLTNKEPLMHSSTLHKSTGRKETESNRLKSTTIVRSNFTSPDRSLSTSVALGTGREKQTRFVSKRFRFRPHTAEQPLFN